MTGLEGTDLGNCRILRRLGGGMSEVYLAEQSALGRQVAVKVVSGSSGQDDGDASQQLDRQSRQEARVIAALDHPHILPVYDYGEQDSLHFLIMAYVPTGSLADMISPGPLHQLSLPLSPLLVADLMSQTAEALQHAHDQGIVHRDVKPGNLLIRLLRQDQLSGSANAGAGQEYVPGRYYVLLSDFGLARFLAAVAEGTSTLGTPLYSAPEQYLGHPVPASDQYALACIAYLLLTGRPVFDGNIAELYQQHLSVQPLPLTRINSKLPPAVNTVLLRALSKEPSDRFPEIVDFSRALRSALNSASPVPSAVWPPAPSPVPAAGGSTPSTLVTQLAPHISQGMTPTQPSTWAMSSAPTDTVRDALESPAYGGSSSVPPESTPSFGNAPTLRSLRQGSNPDAPGAPLPRQFRAEQRWVRVPIKRRSLVIGVAAVLVLTLLTGVGVNLWQRAFSPSAGDQHVVRILKSGSTDVSGLTPLASGQVPESQSTLPVSQIGTDAGIVRLSGLQAISQAGPLPPPAASLGDPDAFAGVTQTIPGLAQSDVGMATPVDASVAASDAFLVELVDGAFLVEDFATPSNDGRFGAAALFRPVLRDGDLLGQGRIFFDVASHKWLFVINETTADSASVSHDYFDIAISQSGDPLSRWQIYQFSTNMSPVTGFGNCSWADYPQIGADLSAFYITGNSFGCGAHGPFLGSVVWMLPRQKFLGATATTLYRFWGYKDQQKRPSMTLTPAVEDSGESMAWFVSTDAGYVDDGHLSNQVMVWAIIHTDSAASQDGVAIARATVTLPYSYADPPAAVQRGASSLVDSGDARVGGAYVVHGHLYATFTTAVNWTGDDQMRSAVYWLDIVPKVGDAGGRASVSAQLAEANIFGFAGAYLYSPAVAVTTVGDLVLTAEASSAVLGPDIIYTSRLHSDPPGSMGQGRGAGFLESADQVAAVSADWNGFSNATVAVSSSGGATSSIWAAGSYSDSNTSEWQTVLAQLNGAGN